MILHFKNKKIESVLTVFPECLSQFEDEVQNPNDSKSRRLKNIIGFGARYRAKETTTMSDLFLYGLNEMISNGRLDKSSIGAIVVVTLCPDYYLPQISSILHGELGLSDDVFCIDIPQACAGFVIGLVESFLLLDHMKEKKVLLCTGEIFHRKAENEPKRTEPSFGGDVGNITVVANSTDGYNDDICVEIRNDGSRRDSLIIRYGAYRNPMTKELIDASWGRTPCSGVEMNGSEVFNFVQKEVPPMIKRVAELSRHEIAEFDYFFFHQPNKFMLQKLATALEIPFIKMPMNITENYGNSDSGTIPVAMTECAGEALKSKDNLCCLSGFGGGLTWAAVVMNIGNMDYCESIKSNL